MVSIEDQPQPDLQEKDCLSRARQGDADAFCQLVESLEERLLRQATSLCRNATDAEDLVSETLIEAWKSLSRYDETCRLSTWLYSILLHRYQKSVRRARSRPFSLSWLPFFESKKAEDQQQRIPTAEPGPDTIAVQDEVSAELRAWVDRLPNKHRDVILLRFFEEASLPDIAIVLNCSVGTVKSRLHHALNKLRQIKMNFSQKKGDLQI